jgi:hypothetical protein
MRRITSVRALLTGLGAKEASLGGVPATPPYNFV